MIGPWFFKAKHKMSIGDLNSPAVPLRPFGEGPTNPFSLEARVARRGAVVLAEFRLKTPGPDDLLNLETPQLKPLSERSRRDELWRHMCLELFIAPADGPGYLELNIAPSGDWNLYAFDSYRAGMREVVVNEAPAFELFRPSDRECLWRVSLNLENEPMGVALRGLLAVGATAVLEYRDGRREYWAIDHRGDKPDFHLRQSFTIAL
jgi:hypothetical protein